MDGLLDIDRTPVKSLIFRKWMVYTRQSYIKVDDLTIESISISWMVYIMEHPMENSTIKITIQSLFHTRWYPPSYKLGYNPHENYWYSLHVHPSLIGLMFTN